jgi:hypothetical protein
MSTAINNSRWAAAFTEKLQAEDELDDAQLIPYQFLPSAQPKDFRRASYRANLPDSDSDLDSDLLEEIPETPPEQEQPLLISPPPLNRTNLPDSDSDSDLDSDLLEEIPETPPEQEQSLLISPPPLNRAPTSLYKERVTIHALRDAGFTLTAISEKVGKPVTTVSYIARNPTTPRKRAVIGHIFNTPTRRDLIRWLLSNPTHRRFSIGEIKHARGYTCSDTTLRRALHLEGYFRFVSKEKKHIIYETLHALTESTTPTSC